MSCSHDVLNNITLADSAPITTSTHETHTFSTARITETALLHETADAMLNNSTELTRGNIINGSLNDVVNINVHNR